MENKDYDVDIFLVYEEVGPVEGKAPPTARKDLCEFWNEKRRPFIKGYHVIAVNPTAQLYLARDLHNTVHGGFLRPAIKPFLQAISSLGFGHIYYGASVLLHNNPFLLIRNGRCVTELQSYSRLDFDVAMSRVNPTIVGQRWNSQYTWAVSSLNIKQNDLSDIVNRPTIKTANVTDGILPQFIALSDLLLEVDRDNKFYCGLLEGNARRIRHAQCLMDEDPLIPPHDQKRNVIESVSGICNVYSRVSSTYMFTGAHNSELGADHRSTGTQGAATNAKDVMKARFKEWRVHLKWVTLFPHIDDFNARERGQNFLCSVSRTVDDDSPHLGSTTKRRLTITFCQRKVHEDTQVREICASKIHEGMCQWTTSLPKMQ
jgi:hypothetical protein